MIPCWIFHTGSRIFSGDLILALLARVLRSLKLNIANNLFHIVGRAFQINYKTTKIIYRYSKNTTFWTKS
jgi:hypothetical protein